MSIFAYQALKGLQLSESAVRGCMAQLETATVGAGQGFGIAVMSDLYLVCDGLVMSTLSNGAEASFPIDIYGPNTWIGGGALFDADAAAARYVAIVPSRVLRLPSASTAQYVLGERPFLDFIGKLLRWRDGHHVAMISAAKSTQSGVRLALLLAILAQGIRCSHSHLPVSTQDSGPLVPTNQTVIADYVGLSRSVVSRYLQELVAAGLMRLNYGSIEFLNTPAWEALYHSHVGNKLKGQRTLTELFSISMESVSSVSYEHV